MKFQFGFMGFLWSHVDVRVVEFPAGFLEFRGVVLFVD